jgi:hypothetical protein
MLEDFKNKVFKDAGVPHTLFETEAPITSGKFSSST